MDLRNNLFGKGPRGGGAGLPGRQVNQRSDGAGYERTGMAPPPSGYDNYGSRSPGRPPGGTPGGYGGGPGGGMGGGGYGAESKVPAYQQQGPPRPRQVPLRLAKVEDKTLQTQYIFGNV